MQRRSDEEIIEDLLMICEELGWDVAIPREEALTADQPNVDGLVIGTEGFIKKFFGQDADFVIKGSEEGIENAETETTEGIEDTEDTNVISISKRKKGPEVH